MQKIKNILKLIDIENLFWIAGLVFLAFIEPNSNKCFSICPIKNLGFHFCPGCGLGQSISLIFHGRIIDSFYVHPLGFFALVVIILRIFKLIFNKINFWRHYARTRPN